MKLAFESGGATTNKQLNRTMVISNLEQDVRQLEVERNELLEGKAKLITEREALNQEIQWFQDKLDKMAIQVTEADKNAKAEAKEDIDDDLLDEISQLYGLCDNLKEELDQKKFDLQEAMQTITKLKDQKSRKRASSPKAVLQNQSKTNKRKQELGKENEDCQRKGSPTLNALHSPFQYLNRTKKKDDTPRYFGDK